MRGRRSLRFVERQRVAIEKLADGSPRVRATAIRAHRAIVRLVRGRSAAGATPLIVATERYAHGRAAAMLTPQRHLALVQLLRPANVSIGSKCKETISHSTESNQRVNVMASRLEDRIEQLTFDGFSDADMRPRAELVLSP